MRAVSRRQVERTGQWEQLAPLVMLTGLAWVIASPTVANVLTRGVATGTWSWPEKWILTSWGVVQGRPADGFDVPPPAVSMGPVWAVWGFLVVVSVGLIIAIAAMAGQRQDGSVRGFASRADAEAALGLSRLRRVRHQIRPDLYPKRRFTWSRTVR